MTGHIKHLSDTELLACLRLVAKIFSHVQSPITHIASPSTSDMVGIRSAKSVDGKVGDLLETADKPGVNSQAVTSVVECNSLVTDDR